jgi:SAM-dependent methyltransferase
VIGGMDSVDAGESRFDIAIMNNSFCYLVSRARRRRALANMMRALRPGGVLVVRNPSRVRLRDQFTGLPLIGVLPPALAQRAGHVLGRNRSNVRLQTVAGARRELRRAGFVAVQSVTAPGVSRPAAPFTAYHHLVARRPGL